ncbi:MAG: TetR/AcrR family transcriptional regulator [Terracoccus sp.]
MDHTRPAAAPVTLASADGRDRRWEQHRHDRRTTLVDATIRAIRVHGASVGMDDIAAEAGTSKTVVYRHFRDKAGLYRAVVARVDERVVGQVSAALTSEASGSTGPRGLVATTVEAYLSLVESDTELYRFVVHRPLVDRPLSDDPLGSTVEHVASELAEVLRRQGTAPDPARARLWALAIVGSVQAVADDWLATDGRAPRSEVVRALTDLVWNGLRSVLDGPHPDTTALSDASRKRTP